MSEHPDNADTTTRPPDGVDEVDLTDLLPNSFVAFVRTHLVTLTRYAYQRLGTIPDADRAVSDVMTELYGRWDELLRASGPPTSTAFDLLLVRLAAFAPDDTAPEALTPRRPESASVTRPGAPCFVEFAARHRPALLRFASRRMGGRTHDAEDVVSDVMFDLYRRWDRIIAHPSPPRALANRMIRDAVVDWRAARGREISVDFTAPETLQIPARGNDQGDHAAFATDLAVVEARIASMPTRRAACARMRLMMQLPVADVAAYLGVEVSTVHTHVSIARRELAAALEHGAPARTTTAGTRPIRTTQGMTA